MATVKGYHHTIVAKFLIKFSFNISVLKSPRQDSIKYVMANSSQCGSSSTSNSSFIDFSSNQLYLNYPGCQRFSHGMLS